MADLREQTERIARGALLGFVLGLIVGLAWECTPGKADITASGTIPTIQVGGVTLTNVGNSLKILSCSATGATNIRCTLALSSAPTAGYAVTTAKTLRIKAVQFRDDTPGSPSTVTFYQSDNDVGQTGASTALTNGAQKSFAFPLIDLTTQPQSHNAFATNFTVAAAKYLTAQLSAVAKGVSVIAYGYEE